MTDRLARGRLVHLTSMFGEQAPVNVARIMELVRRRRAGDVFAAGVLAAMYSPAVGAIGAPRFGFSAARHKMQKPGLAGYGDLDSLALGRSLRPGRGKVFISHAHQDAPLVKALEALFHAGSPRLRDEQFF